LTLKEEGRTINLKRRKRRGERRRARKKKNG